VFVESFFLSRKRLGHHLRRYLNRYFAPIPASNAGVAQRALAKGKALSR